MDAKERAMLEAAGYQVGGIQELLGLTDEETRVIELRVSLGRAIRRIRQERDLTQAAVGKMVATTQSRIARVEQGLPGVTLDQAFRVLFALGGDMGDIQTDRIRETKAAAETASRKVTGRIVRRAPRSKAKQA
ncbi:MAG: hypothetical protein JWN86_3620 [Planctomycetota bacterium]|nr:hypothetical protein [Planctomycetota bacterium]